MGQDWKGLAALIVPDAESTKGLSEQELRDLYTSEIRTYVSTEAGFQRFHLIRDFEILPGSFVVGEEITATLKPMRRKIDTIYEADISALYDRIHKK